MRRRRLALAAALVAAPCAALAYVRTTTSTGAALAWRAGCPRLVVAGPAHPEISAARLRASLQRSAAAWTDGLAGCSGFRIDVQDGERRDAPIAFDRTNVVVWRLPGFCDDPDHADNEVCLAPNAAAVTTIFYYDRPGRPEDGELLDLDVQLNAARFDFADDGRPDRIDLDNTLTHELGHGIGLDHPCRTERGGVVPRDDQGLPVPPCFPTTDLPPEVLEATMYNFEAPGEVKKRDPLPAELDGLCAIYAGHDGTCAIERDDGCAAGGGGARPGAVVAALAALALAMRRRRRP